jgi:hypothetical protein
VLFSPRLIWLLHFSWHLELSQETLLQFDKFRRDDLLAVRLIWMLHVVVFVVGFSPVKRF